MKTAGWYFVHGGRRLMAETRAEIRKLAQKVADMTGESVTVRPIPKPAADKRKAAPKRKTLKARRNPDSDLVHFFTEVEKAKRQRREYVARTKGARLAKSLRGRDRGGSAKAAETAARKTAKFQVHAKNRRDVFTLYRPSRRAADGLAEQFRAAGYTVTVQEV